jgi:hypothetical protein
MTAHEWLMLSGWITLAITAGGVSVMAAHVWFFRNTKNVLGRHLRAVFLTDVLVYTVTAAFGIFLLLDLDIEHYLPLQPLRIAAFLANIWAAVRLYRHYMTL